MTANAFPSDYRSVECMQDEDAPVGRPKRTSIVDVRYKLRGTSQVEAIATKEEPRDSRIRLSEHSADLSPSAGENVSLGDEVFKNPEHISSVFKTKCANLLNLVTSFAFTARLVESLPETPFAGFRRVCEITVKKYQPDIITSTDITMEISKTSWKRLGRHSVQLL